MQTVPYSSHLNLVALSNSFTVSRVDADVATPDWLAASPIVGSTEYAAERNAAAENNGPFNLLNVQIQPANGKHKSLQYH